MANRNTGRVFIEHANQMTKANDTFIVLRGDVRFSRGPMLMYCDSAWYYPETESLDAFSNVRMEQGDTLFIYADELNYNGPEQTAYLYADEGDSVRLINRDVTLRTPVFVYDLGIDLGYYNVGGSLTDLRNRLTSLEGEYVPATKDANFYNDVRLVSPSRDGKDTLRIHTDTLYYNTATHVAELYSPSTVYNSRGTVYTSDGTYDTDADTAVLYSRSLIVTRQGNTLTGDTIFYDYRQGYGRAIGDMLLTDSIRQADLSGDYGFYNQLTDSSYVTGRALAREYSKGDTLWLHGVQMQTFRRIDSMKVEADTVTGTPAKSWLDTTMVMTAWPRVRFYRSDMQGLCDSMRYEQRDSILSLYRHPVVWNGERQIFGNVINVKMGDSTIQWARLPQTGFSAEHVDEEFYQQLSGKEMMAYFTDGDISHLDVSGNVQAIYLPMENDSTYNKLFSIESSFLAADFHKRQLVRMKFWPETQSTGTPLFLAKKSIFYLPRFKWYESLRPTDPMDVFRWPDGMEDLLQSEEAPTSRMSRVTAAPVAPGR